ncbi:hypothetical protein GVN18_38525 [Pseudomonas sp. ODNR1LW]|nr:hypothetical protein [Pseudomonas sp. ODNR1LW]
MSTELTAAKNALEGFATYLETFWSDQPFHHSIGGWNVAPVSTKDMASRVRLISQRISSIKTEEMKPELQNKIKEIPERIAWFQSNAIPQLPGGNAQVVLSNFDYLMTDMEMFLPFDVVPSWEEVSKSDLIPKNMARRLRNLESAIARLEPRSGVLEEQLQTIRDAHQAALDLPTDLQSLQEAREEIHAKADDVLKLVSKIADTLEVVEEHAEKVAEREDVAAKLISNIEAAYSAATTKGLAGAFTERARSLTQSTRYWVALLSTALAVGAVIGYIRLDSFQQIAETDGVNPQVLWINAGMSLLSIAAPVWFAWLATRQIGQRFRLAEDYAFKASVARAYEGYRKEAARLDPELEIRLFASALDRLDEAPLRFLSTEEHGSPYESLFASTGFQKALEKIPSLRDTVAAALDRAGDSRSRATSTDVP